MDLNDYFNPVSLVKPEHSNLSQRAIFCKNITINTPDSPIPALSGYDIALAGLPEESGGREERVTPADRIRNSLYQLFRLQSRLKIIDLGNLKAGNRRRDTICALRDVTLDLLEKGIVVINLGGTQDLTYGSYLAFESSVEPLNFVTVDSRLDMGIIDDEIRAESYLIPILSGNPDLLISYTNLGHQKYFIDQQDLDYLSKHHFQSIRLGDIRSNISSVEPYMRDANLVSIDLNSIKQADAPGSTHPSPNGFYSEEICQISKYSGLGNRIKCFGVYNLSTGAEIHDMTAQLAAQVIWHFIEGYTQRITESPVPDSRDYRKFIVNMNNLEHDIVFYKSIQTERWWCEVPVHKRREDTGNCLFLSCSQEDYSRACNQEIPDRWWKVYKKFN